MQVTVKKKALYDLLSMIAEGRTGDTLDMMDKFIGEDEPIKPVEMMSSQLTQIKPPVGDDEYVPATVSELSNAAAAIAEEVPPSQIDFYYRKLHELLDDAIDKNRDAGYDPDYLAEVFRQIVRESNGPRKFIVKKTDSGNVASREFGQTDSPQIPQTGSVLDTDTSTQEELDYVESPEEEAKFDAMLDSVNEYESLALKIKSFYSSILGKYNQLSKMGMRKSDLDEFQSNYPFIIGTAKTLGDKRPSNDSERHQVIQSVVNEVFESDAQIRSDYQNLINSMVGSTGKSRSAIENSVKLGVLVNLIRDPYFVKIRSADPIGTKEVIQMEANRTFDILLAASDIDTRRENVSEDQVNQVEANVNEYIKDLKKEDSITLQGQTFPILDFVNELLAVLDQYKSEKITLKQDLKDQGVVDLDAVDISVDEEDIEEELQEVEAVFTQSGKWTDLAPWFEHGSESAIRQWYLKHLAVKFNTVLKGRQNPDEFPGAAQFAKAYSDHYLYVLDALVEYIPMFVEKKKKSGKPEDLKYAEEAEKALADLVEIQEAAASLDNILDVEDSSQSADLTYLMRNSTGGNILSNINSKKFESVTSFLMAKVDTDLGASAYAEVGERNNINLSNVPNNFIWPLTGKSSAPNFEEPDKGIAKKMIAAGITPMIFAEVLVEYQEDLDKYFKTTFGKGGELKGKIDKADKISEEEVVKAFNEYIVSLYRQSKEESIGQELQELYTILKKLI